MKRTALVTALALCALFPLSSPAENDVQRLVSALLADTPLEEDLWHLTDGIGGRPTGSAANLASVEWGLEAFAAAGVEARREAFQMPVRWLERSAAATVLGDAEFPVAVAAMPFSTATPEGGLTAPLVDAGDGSADDFARLGEAAVGAFALVQTAELRDIPGLFAEYASGAEIEGRAIEAGVAGVVYQGSRSRNVLHRHNASRGKNNRHPMLIMERDGARRALRLLRSGRALSLRLELDLDTGGPYESHNVIGEIKGSGDPEEFVVIGAHLDSWGLGTGALDNGCNVALVIDVARQMKRLGLIPRRTIRFALWNGEEQGLNGSWGYTLTHADELDRHVMAASFDIGSGRITGMFTNGRAELLPAVEAALAPVRGLGPFENINAPIVGTDNYDFMMQGIGNLVANQESANYGPNYHARSDTFDKVDLRQVKLNAAIAAAVTWGFANMEVSWGRQSREELERLIETTDLGGQMRMFGLWDSWADGTRGRN